MVKCPKEFQFICNDEITYHINGAEVKTCNLTLKAPSMMSSVAPLISQDIMIAIRSNVDSMKVSEESQKQIQNQQQEDEKITIKSRDILTLLYSAKVIDMNKFREKFIKLLLERNICLLDNQIPITKAHFEYISYDESNRLMGEYLSNFLIP